VADQGLTRQLQHRSPRARCEKRRCRKPEAEQATAVLLHHSTGHNHHWRIDTGGGSDGMRLGTDDMELWLDR
jgi:hypothetical protein